MNRKQSKPNPANDRAAREGSMSKAQEVMPNYRKTWHHWLLWWKIDPVELRRQVKGYDTLPRMYSARGLGCLLAMVVGIWQIMIKGRYLWAMSGGWAPIEELGWAAGVIEFSRQAVMYRPSFSEFAAGWVLVILGSLVYRGSRAAMRGMMVMWTIDIIFVNDLALIFRTIPCGRPDVLPYPCWCGRAACTSLRWRCASSRAGRVRCESGALTS